MRKRAETQLHFVGIGGIGMSGIAELFLNQGYRITGSDLADSEITRRLAQMGARVSIGHQANNVSGSHVVVISSAVTPDNPEVLEAQRLKIPVIPRAEMLGELMRGKTGIAVAGTHGKTTTTSMLGTVLSVAGIDPTLVIGGKVDSLGGNAKLGAGRFVVAEADESDGSFLHLPTTYAVITNIDSDHLDHFGTLRSLDSAFVSFVAKIPFYGVAAVCGDDPGIQRCLPRFSKPVLTYGFSEECHFQARNMESRGMATAFEVYARSPGNPDIPAVQLGRVAIRVPGRHNVLNALATIAIGTQLDLPFATIVKGLYEFRGVRRRFEIKYEDPAAERLVVDDYGHHPTEIRATIAAARSFWPGRVITIFQPHRYSRTQRCHSEFLEAFQDTDVLLVTDIYSAGEAPIEGVDSKSLAAAIRKKMTPGRTIEYVGDFDGAKNKVCHLLQKGDLILCLGAGSIGRLSDVIASELAKPGGFKKC